MGEGIVSKFGGSSVRDAAAMRRCADIVRGDSGHKVVVVSATYNTTNHLEVLAAMACADLRAAGNEWQRIYARHVFLADELGVSGRTRDPLRLIDVEAMHVLRLIGQARILSGDLLDCVYSWGERMSSLIFAAFLGAPCLDARLVLKTDHQHGNARPLIRETRQAAQKVLMPQICTPGELVVTQGFIGSTLDGITTTLGREGSDYSGALFAESIGARKLTIWTDVPGVATADPKHVSDVRYIPVLSYEQATMMASTGANVLFPRTLEPAQRAGIEVFVRSSLDAVAAGTSIRSDAGQHPRPLAVTSLAAGGAIIVSLIGHRLGELDDFSPGRWLAEHGMRYEVDKQDPQCFSFRVSPMDRAEALQLLHDYLLAYDVSSTMSGADVTAICVGQAGLQRRSFASIRPQLTLGVPLGKTR